MSSKIRVEWKADRAMWIISGGKLEEPTMVSTVELKEKFPMFVKASEEFCKELTSPLSEDDVEALIGCSANSLAEIVPSRQRYAVYRAVACFLGYKDRTELLAIIEESIKKTWAEPGDVFVGYKEG